MRAKERSPGRPQSHRVTVGHDDGLIGEKLRTLRRNYKKTLKEVADLTGISIGHLSQLERDLASPSVKTLHDISRALGVNISWFFLQADVAEMESHYVIRKESRRHIHFSDGIDDYQLNSLAVRKLGLLYSTFEPGASSGDEPYSHEGEEAGLVVSGELELFIDGKSARLASGDSFSFSSERKHKYWNPGTVPAVVIWAMTPPTY